MSSLTMTRYGSVWLGSVLEDYCSAQCISDDAFCFVPLGLFLIRFHTADFARFDNGLITFLMDCSRFVLSRFSSFHFIGR